MKKLFLTSAVVFAAASTGFASLPFSSGTQTIPGLIVPSSGASVTFDVVATQLFETEGIAALAWRNLPTRFQAFDGTEGSVPIHAFVWKGEVQEHRSDKDAIAVFSESIGSSIANASTAYWQNAGNTDTELYFSVVKPLTEVEEIAPIGILAHG